MYYNTHMEKRAYSQLNNSENAKAADAIALALEQCDIPSDLRIRYSYLVEEALLKWREKLPSDAVFTARRYEDKSNVKFTFTVVGDMVDPLYETQTDDPVEKLVSMLKSGTGSEVTYKYKKPTRKNVLSIVIPKKRAEEKLFNREVWTNASFTITQTLLMSFATIADTIMLGFLDTNSMSAAGLISSFSALFTAIFVALANATTIHISRAWGRRDIGQLHEIFTVVIKCGVILGAIVGAATFLFTPQIMSFYTNIPGIAAEGEIYLKILSLHYLFLGFSQVAFAVLRNLGKVRYTSIWVIISQLLNIALNAVLIFGLFGAPAMGIKGAAISTVISSAVLVIVAAIGWTRERFLRLSIKEFLAPHRESFADFIKTALPLIFQTAIYNVARNVIASIFGHLSADIVAANSIRDTASLIFSSAKSGYADVAGVKMGQVLGRGKIDQAKRYSGYILKNAVRIGVAVGVLVLASIPLFTLIYSGQTEGTLYYMKIMFIILAIYMVFSSMCHILVCSVLLVAKDVKPIVITDAVVLWGIIVPLGLLGLYVFDWPAMVMIIILNLDQVIAFSSYLIRYKTGKWLEKSSN